MKRLIALAIALATAMSMALPVIGATEDAPVLAPSEGEVEAGEFNSYIVVMQAEPLVVTEGQDNLDSNRAQQRAEELIASHEEALEEAGVDSGEIVNTYVNSLNGFSATLNHAQAEKVATSSGVAMVIPDELQQVNTDSSPSFLGLDGRGDAWRSGVTGEGVVVGIIDTGIWPEHPSFADDGSYGASPIGSVPCEFGNTAHHADDAPFTCNGKLLGARQMLATYRALIGAEDHEFDSARDDNGHGTHTASTAAGNANVRAEVFDKSYGKISGIAPRARIVAYKGLGELGGFTSDLAAAIDQAVADGVDVINYSIGGGASAPGIDEIAFLFAADAGVFVATSAGNSGPDASTVGNPGTMPWLTTVGASTQRRFIEGTIKLGDRTVIEGASITPSLKGTYKLVDAEDAGDDLCQEGNLDPEVVQGAIVLCRRGVNARAAKSLAVQTAGGVGMILYENTDDNNLFTDNHWVPTVHIDNTPGLKIKAYIDKAGNRARASITGTGKIDVWKPAPSMANFSSRGPNPVSPDIIKPDVTAPGFQILAGYSPFVDPGSTPPGELFAAIAGTSMSSPHVAGLFALLKQEHPDWSAAAAKSALMTTAYQKVRDHDRRSQADPFDFGAGHVDPGGPRERGSAFQPGLIYDAGLFEYAAYTCGEEFGVFTPGSCDFLEANGIPTDPSNLNLPSIGVADVAGSFTVTRTVTSVASDRGVKEYRAKVDAPKGYKVTVNPSTIRLRSGETATFEVEIVNRGAPVGAWRFGSLTWKEKGGQYEVYSPIAVKGAAMDAPTEVIGSGTEGEVTVDVAFGYSGDYDAVAHGLVPPLDGMSGSVDQDPDNSNWSPAEDGVGTRSHEIVVTDTALLRIQLGEDDIEPSAGVDIDLFLFNSAGVQVASSTAGGTEELIELVNPSNDTYTLYVHGWQTTFAPGAGEVAYGLNVWTVPNAGDTGPLVITAEPESATQGTVGQVTAAWTGLEPDRSYLGAISHHDGSGVLGYTWVRVDS